MNVGIIDNILLLFFNIKSIVRRIALIILHKIHPIPFHYDYSDNFPPYQMVPLRNG